MEFIPFDNTIKLEALFLQDGQQVANVHYYLVDEVPDVDTCRDLAESYITWWDTNIKGGAPSTLALVMVRCTIMETETSPGVEVATGLPLAGTSGSPAMPNNVTVAIKWSTGLRGRSYRGRTFHIGLTEATVTGNVLAAGMDETLAIVYGDLIALDTDVGPAIMGLSLIHISEPTRPY